MNDPPQNIFSVSEHSRLHLGLGRIFLLAIGSLFFTAGCAKEAPYFGDVKGVDERVSDREFEAFLEIIDRLPNKTIPELPITLLPRPHWRQDRTLEIQDLVRQEREGLNERWNVEWMTRQLPMDRTLQRTLRREQMSPKQFVGLILAIGSALTLDSLDSSIDLQNLVTIGEKELEDLEHSDTAFSSLSVEDSHAILQEAAWVTVVNRVRRLLSVPPENLVRVRKHREKLRQIFPDDLKRDPLTDLANVINERGIPFEELPESGSDEFILWDTRESMTGATR